MVRKVNLVSLLDTLKDLYDRGVDFVDIYGVTGEEQDTIGVSFPKHYMNEEFIDNFDTFGDVPVASKVDVKLTDDDINQLL